MTLLDQLEIVAACALGIKTKGMQVWDVDKLIHSDVMADYLDCVATIEWGAWEYDGYAYHAKIRVAADVPFTLYVTD